MVGQEGLDQGLGDGIEEGIPTTLVDYEDIDDADEDQRQDGDNEVAPVKGSYAAAGGESFADMLLQPPLTRALQTAGFEHPSEIQSEAIPKALAGKDLLCQAKSGMGKTAVFVLSILNLIRVASPVKADRRPVQCMVIAHTRELAYQIKNEFQRFCQHMTHIRYEVFFGGTPVEADKAKLQSRESPDIVIGTPGRLKGLISTGDLKTDEVKYFVLDECDQCLQNLRMREEVQSIFFKLPRNKQSMFLTATLVPEIKEICMKMLTDPCVVCVDERALTLDGLSQYYCDITETLKMRRLSQLLDDVDFNQVVIFVSNGRRAYSLKQTLTEAGFPTECIFGAMQQQQRLQTYQDFKAYKTRILIATDIFGRGIDIERVNLVVNYDMPQTPEQYLHRVGRAGRFGTAGIAVSFVQPNDEKKILDETQAKFETKMDPLPKTVSILNRHISSTKADITNGDGPTPSASEV